MIRYRLQCKNGHEFEAWFKNSSAYDRQIKSGQLTCAECGSGDISKAMMAPSVGGRAKSTDVTVANREATSSDKRAELLALMQKVREEVTKNAEYVGPRFAEEARKIHYEEADPRGIYGEASLEDARALEEEGVEFYPLPRLKDDHN